jgi:hypothetical protein
VERPSSMEPPPELRSDRSGIPEMRPPEPGCTRLAPKALASADHEDSRLPSLGGSVARELAEGRVRSAGLPPAAARTVSTADGDGGASRDAETSWSDPLLARCLLITLLEFRFSNVNLIYI